MATSNVAIANRALQHLGAARISDLSQDSKSAREMNTAFVPVRDALLEEYDWNFAITRVSQAKLSGEDPYEGLNRFLLPDDFIRLLIDDETATKSTTEKDWQIENAAEGRVLMTADDSPLNYRYIAQITDPTRFSKAFDETLAVDLAINTCYAITGSGTLLDRLGAARTRMVNRAKRTNAIQNQARQPKEDSWIQVMR